MAADETIGKLGVEITGDDSPLQQAIDNAVASAEKGADAIASAFSDAGQTQVENLVSTLDQLAAKEQELQDAFQQAASVYNDTLDAYRQGEISANVLEAAYEQLDTAAKNAGQALGEAGGAAEHAGESAHEAGDKFEEMATELAKMGGIAFTAEKAFELVKDTITEAFQAFSQVQTATTALTALTKDAQGAVETIENLKGLAISDALSFPSLVQATQKMTAFGIATEDIPGALRAAADAAAATGNAFDNVTGAIERLSLSGNAGTRQLVQLGLSTQDLARVMGVSAEGVKDAFKELDPTERVAVIVDALDKFKGTAQAVAQGIGQQWQNLKTQWEFVLEEIGKAIEPLGQAFISLSRAAIDSASVIATAYSDLASTLGSAFHDIGDEAKSAWDELVPKDVQAQLPSFSQLVVTELTGNIQLALKGLTATISTLHEKWSGLMVLFGQSSSTMGDALAASLKKASDAAAEANAHTKDLGNALVALTPAVKGAEDASTAAADAVKKASDAVAEEKARLDAGQGSWSAYVRLVQQYDQAVTAATPHSKDFADSLAGITKAISDAQAKYDNALKVFQQATDLYDKGKISAEALAAAEKKLDDAYTAINPKLKDHATGLDAIYEATNKARQAWSDAQDTLRLAADALKNGQASILDFNIAVKQARDAAQAAGVAFADPGNGLAGALTVLAQSGEGAAVIINDKLVGAVQALADAAPDVTTSMKDVGATIQESGTKMVGAADSAEKLADDWVKCNDAGKNLLPTVIKLTDSAKDLGNAMQWDETSAAALVDKFNDVDASAKKAADSINTLAQANRDEEAAANSNSKSGGKGGGAGGSVHDILGWFEDVASAYGQVGSGVTLANLDQMAQMVADQTGVTIQTPDGIFRPKDAAKTKGANTDQYGRPLASSSSGSSASSGSSGSSGLSSGVTASPYDALAGAAGSAAIAVSGLASASNSAVTPLGAFADSATLWAEATKASTSAANSFVPVVQALSKSASDFYTVQEKASGVVSQATQSYDSALASSINAQNSYTQALADLRNGASISADQLYALQKAVSDTSDALSLLTGEGAFGDAAQKVTTALLDTSRSATDFYTVQEKASGAVSATTQAYDQALATSTNAQNAYSNALAQVRAGANISADALYALQKAATDAQQSLTFLSGVSKGETNGPTRASADALHLAPDVAKPPNPPAGTSDPNNTGGYEWSPNQDKWIWNSNLQGIAGHGAISGGYDPFSNIPTAPYTPHPLDVPIGSVSGNNGGVPQVTLNVTVGGTYVGPNAGQQLADLAAPAIVASLRRAGIKL